MAGFVVWDFVRWINLKSREVALMGRAGTMGNRVDGSRAAPRKTGFR